MPVSNSLGDSIILHNGLMRHHKVTYVVGKGILRMVLVDHGQFYTLNRLLFLSVLFGFFCKTPEINVNEVFIV